MRTGSPDRIRRSLAPATGRRIAFPTPADRMPVPEADLSDPSPVSEMSGVAPSEGAGTTLALLIPRDRGVGAAERHIIRQPRVTIGRGEDNDVVIDDPSVSAHHAHLALEGGVWTLAGLDPGAGTTVDGAGVQGEPIPLATGSSLRLGTVELSFSPHDRWQDSEPPPRAVLDTAGIARVAGVGTDFSLGVPDRGGLPVPLLIGLGITLVAILGYLLSQGG